MFAMITDNLFWVSASPEYAAYKANKFPLTVEGNKYSSKVDYILRYRVWSVIKNWRDIVPAILTSGLLTGVGL